MHRLELSCKTQIAAMSCNTKLIDVPADVVESTYQNYQPHVRRPFGVLDWPALMESDGFKVLDMLQTVRRGTEVAVNTTRSPLRVDGHRAAVASAAPTIGEHNLAIRAEFGL